MSLYKTALLNRVSASDLLSSSPSSESSASAASTASTEPSTAPWTPATEDDDRHTIQTAVTAHLSWREEFLRLRPLLGELAVALPSLTPQDAESLRLALRNATASLLKLQNRDMSKWEEILGACAAQETTENGHAAEELKKNGNSDSQVPLNGQNGITHPDSASQVDESKESRLTGGKQALTEQGVTASQNTDTAMPDVPLATEDGEKEEVTIDPRAILAGINTQLFADIFPLVKKLQKLDGVLARLGSQEPCVRSWRAGFEPVWAALGGAQLPSPPANKRGGGAGKGRARVVTRRHEEME